MIRSLRSFILEYAKSEFGDEDFVDDCLGNLIDGGRVFLLLDGFDEIGTVINQQDGSPLIHLLSCAIFQFLTDQCDGRGILSSRPFRSPTRKFHHHVHLRILPMSDDRVGDFIRKRIGARADAVIEHLYREQSDLVPFARNPFFAMLLVEYVRRHQTQANCVSLPADKATFYFSFMDSRLEQIIAKPRFQGLSTTRLLDARKKVAYHMIQSAALDLPGSELLEIADLNDEELACLADEPGARLIRIRRGDQPVVSFVHRKFAEYFAAQVTAQDTDLPTDSIPRDSAWRDTLAMLCEIVEPDRAQQIAGECRDTLSRGYLAGNSDARREAIHYFRFLIDAFGTRREACVDFADEMGEQIFKRIRERDLVPAGFMVELAGMLKPKNLADILSEVINWDNRLINQIAFWSCRNLEEPDPRIDHRLGPRLAALPPLHHLTRGRKLQKSLAWSNAFRKLRPFNRWLWIEDLTLTLCLVLSIGILGARLMSGNLLLAVTQARSLRLEGSPK